MTLGIVIAVCATLIVLEAMHLRSRLLQRPLSREAYLEQRRVLERDRAEWMRTKPRTHEALVGVTREIAAIDQKLLKLAERMPPGVKDDVS